MVHASNETRSSAHACFNKGYGAVEIAGTRENLKIDPDELRRILRRLSLELTCISVGVPFSREPSRLNLHSQDQATRSESLNYVFECIDYASKAGVRFVYVCSIVKEESGQSDASMCFKESLGKCVEYGEKCGVLVAVEPFPFGLYPSIEDGYQLVSQVDGAGLVFDIGHEALCKRPVSFPIQNADLILDVHVNNNDGVNDKHWSPEKGVILQV